MSSEEQEFAAFIANTMPTVAAETPKPAETAPAEEKKPDVEAKETPSDQKPKAEAKAEPKDEKKPDPKKDWDEIARKEREKRAAKALARAEAGEKDKIIADLRAKADRLASLEDKKGKSKLEVLKELGISIDDVNDEYVNTLDPKAPKEDPAQVALRAELAEVKATLAEFKREKEEAQKSALAAHQAQLFHEIRAEAREAIKSQPDEFELLSQEPKADEIVFHLIAGHADETTVRDKHGAIIESGEKLTTLEACRRVEAKLLAKATKFASAKKVQAALGKSGTTTLSSGMREATSGDSSGGDDNQDFAALVSKLDQQQVA